MSSVDDRLRGKDLPSKVSNTTSSRETLAILRSGSGTASRFTTTGALPGVVVLVSTAPGRGTVGLAMGAGVSGVA